MAVNAMGMFYPGKINHWVSVHRDAFEPTMRFWRRHQAEPPEFHHPSRWNQFSSGGSSGLFAVRVGIALGYDKIVLAGIPLDGTGHWYDPPKAKPRPYLDRATRLEWAQLKQSQDAIKVRSVSGVTKTWFGEPTEDWLDG